MHETHKEMDLTGFFIFNIEDTDIDYTETHVITKIQCIDKSKCVYYVNHVSDSRPIRSVSTVTPIEYSPKKIRLLNNIVIESIKTVTIFI